MIALSLAAPVGGEQPACSALAELIEQARHGDRAAFDDLIRRHERLVLGTAVRLVAGGREEAKDAAQQVFLRLYRHLGQFRPDNNLEQSFVRWLYRITVNVCCDLNRRHRSRHLVLLEDRASGEVPADDVLLLEQRRRLVADALQSLPEKERAAIVLRDVRGLTTREVAHILGSSEATVRSQICAGRQKIRALIEGRLA